MAIDAATTGPDQRSFEADASSPSFLAGIHRGDWTVDRVDWPTIIITFHVARQGRPSVEYTLRVDLTNYPAAAPTATLWDQTANAPLAAPSRPAGEFAAVVFRTDWENGGALYAPYDRVALSGHSGWSGDHPRYAWNSTRNIAWWARRVRDVLNDEDDHVPA